MRKLTGAARRGPFYLALAAILSYAACSDRTPLHGSGGAPGMGAYYGGDGIAPPGGGGGDLALGGASGMGAYYGGDGIAPLGGGGALFGGGGYPNGGSGGTGGVDTNCFMRCGQGNAIYYSTGGAGGSADARSASSDGDASSCDARRELYYAAVQAAEPCDPAAAVPCAAYDGVECPPTGVNPDAVASLTAKLSEYKAAGCSLPRHSCPIVVMTPPPYTCQAGADGVYRCYSLCEQMSGGRATCVSQATGCAGVALSAGFCSGTSMLCCSS